MKHPSEVPSGENGSHEKSSHGVRLQSLKRRILWPAVAGVVIATTGVVIAQNAPSRLPAPPTPPAPVAGAPLPPHAAPSPDGRPERAPRADGPGHGPKHGPRRGPDDGPGRGTRPAPPDANTQEGAARGLERAYRAAGEVGTVNGDARDVAAAARTFYARAITAFNAKNYAQAFGLAEGSHRLNRTARALSKASGARSAMVPGLTPPPVVAKPQGDAEHSACELRRNFDEANRAANFNNAATNRYSAQSEENYRAALQAYNAKRFEEAAKRAHLGAEQAKAAREYAEVLAL